MKSAAILLTAISLPFFSATNVNFDSMQSGQLPVGWSSSVTNRGLPPQWQVELDPTAPSRPNVLAQLSKAGARYRFPVCLFDKITCLDGDLSVKLKIVSGRDLDAGVVFRAADQNNYYLVRASARDHNIVMFKVHDGHFQPVPVKGAQPGSVGVVHPIRAGDWNLLRITYKGPQTNVYFNHRKVFEASDETLSMPGRTGLWTKSDTVAYFDDFRIDKKK